MLKKLVNKWPKSLYSDLYKKTQRRKISHLADNLRTTLILSGLGGKIP